jgi:hypothetical protein
MSTTHYPHSIGLQSITKEIGARLSSSSKGVIKFCNQKEIDYAKENRIKRYQMAEQLINTAAKGRASAMPFIKYCSPTHNLFTANNLRSQH